MLSGKSKLYLFCRTTMCHGFKKYCLLPMPQPVKQITDSPGHSHPFSLSTGFLICYSSHILRPRMSSAACSIQRFLRSSRMDTTTTTEVTSYYPTPRKPDPHTGSGFDVDKLLEQPTPTLPPTQPPHTHKHATYPIGKGTRIQTDD